ncbi:MAG: signal peptide peptidase SppA [Bacteroidota bacterium]
MGNFLKILFGSCLGTVIGLGVLFFLGFSMIAGLASAGEQKPTVEANSILTIDLQQVPELTGNVPMDNGIAAFDLDPEEVLGVHDIVRTLEKAKEDDNIKGVYLNNMYQGGGIAKLRDIRTALADFRSEGKFVVSFAPSYDQSAYYLASAGDEVYLGPLGILDFRGVGVQRTFYKNMLDRLGVKMEIFWAGDFKSATEPFRRTNMSKESKLQTRQYASGLWNYIVEDVAASRGKTPAQIRAYANDITGWKGEPVVDAGLVDDIMTRSEVDARLHELVGFEPDQKLKKITLEKYFAAKMKKLKGGGKDEVAVLFAEGGISDGKAQEGAIGDKSLIKEIDALAQDDDVKAVVLRVNSGGGSASASENIWYAAEKLKDMGKPFVVSMGAVAASGGYYIAAGADSIFAEPETITGSIGVFMMFPDVQEMMDDKLGITFDTVSTAAHANDFSPFMGLSEDGKSVLKQRSSIVYEAFLDRVAEGRGLDKKAVRKIAGGRVYLAPRAKEIGLVDRIGGLDEAIASATALADLDEADVRVGHYPRIKPPLERLLEDLLGEDAVGPGFGAAAVREQLGAEYYQQWELLKTMSTTGKAQAVLPETVSF